AMFFRNDTQSFVDTLYTSDDDTRYTMKQVRREESRGVSKRRRQALVEYTQAKVQQKRGIANEKAQRVALEKKRVDGVDIVFDSRIIGKMTIKKLDDQLNKLRQ
ncbi:hypothetical protein BV22DRAFT_986239, partial [Leucogyrophana mollusca]